MRTIKDLLQENLTGKVVFVRADLNVPFKKDGRISDTNRIEKFAPTALKLCEAGAKVLVSSHMGRPDGKDENFSLIKIKSAMETVLDKKISFVEDCIGASVKSATEKLSNGDILLLENLRFYKQEKNCDEEFSKSLSNGIDYYVNDAFATSHRAHASTFGITKFLPSFAGLLMENEITQLSSIYENPIRPICAIIGGAKVSSKIEVLKNLSQKFDKIIIGGAMANTFLAAKGYDMGKSLLEENLVEDAKQIIENAKKNNCEIILPVDLSIGKEFANTDDYTVVASDKCPTDYMALDFGPKTIDLINEKISECKTMLWNGPLGAFEISPFEKATFTVANKVAELTKSGKLKSIAGGGDVVSALKQSGNFDNISYVSTAGGAFLEWIEGKELPAIKVLK